MQPGVSMYPGQQRRAGGPGSRPSSANPRGISAVGSRISSFHPSSHSNNTGAASVASPPRGSGSMQDALVTNLKQQVACFETEVKYLKEKLISREESHHRGGGGEASSRPLTGRSMGSGVSQLSGGSNEFLARRAQELEEEVDTLRMRYAEREQQHALEVAAIKAGEGVSGLSAVHGAAGKFKNEMERREYQSKNEMSSMRDLHAQEVVMLQKTVERLQRELQYATGSSSANTSSCGDHMPSTTRKTLAEELVAFKDQLRAMTDENMCLKRQHEDMLSALSNEQQQRRALEASNSELKKENEALGGEVKSKLESKIEGLEAKAKQAHASEVTKHYEMERARAAETKLKDDLDSAIRDKLDAEEKMNKAVDEKATLDAKLASIQETLTDATGERDYYRLQHDRLLTEHKLAETKTKQLESKVEADRHSIQLLEKQYCGTLDEIDSMRRQHVAKEDSYRDLDNNDNATRRENYVLKQDCERLKQKLNLLEEDNQFMQRRYDSVRHLADQSAAEGQIRSALGRLGKTKEELQNLLQTQMRLANELSSAMCDIPDLATVAGAIHHSDMSHHQHGDGSANSSSAAVVEQNREAISKIREELNKVTSKIKAEEVRLAPLLSSATLDPSPSAALYPPMPPQSPKVDDAKILGTPPNNQPLSIPPVQQQQQQQQPPVAANLAPTNSFYGHYPPTYTPGYLSNVPQQQQQPNYAPPSYPLYTSSLPPQQQQQQSPVAVDPTQEVPSSRPATASEARVYSSVNGA